MALTVASTIKWLRKHVLHMTIREADILLDVLKVRAPTPLSGAGAVIPGDVCMFTSTGAGNALTLANGTYPGQVTTVVHSVKGSSGTGVITPANGDHTSVTLTAVGDAVGFIWDGSKQRLEWTSGSPTITG